MALLKPRKPAAADGQMELMEHLGELRTRIFRSVVYILVGMALTYNLFHQIYDVLSYPLQAILGGTATSGPIGTVAIREIQSGFLIRMQVSLIAGLVVAFPLVVLELWGFIEPALTPAERKPVTYLAPFSVLLFLAGVGTGYSCLPAAYAWMAGYIRDIPGAQLIQDAQSYVLLTVKIMLAFGVSFQLPLVLLFLARVGLITADLMTTYWRHATVGIAVIAAVLTPSNDPLTMLMMAVPMAALYLLSIGLVRAFEPKADGSRNPSLVPMLVIALAPVCILGAVGYWLYRTNPRAAAHNAPSPHLGQTPAENTARAKAIDDLQKQMDDLRRRLDALEGSGKPAPPAPPVGP